MASIPVLLLRPGAAAPAPAPLVKSHPALYPGPRSRAQAEAGNYAKRRLSWQGLTIRIENEAGTVREGPGWQTRMLFPYGEIEDSEGVDGDRVDVYVGPDLETAPFVYVIHQRRVGRWDEYDEDKCMLGFASEEEAAIAFLKHYDDPRFLGPITVMSVPEFVAKVRATKDNPQMLKAAWFGGDLLLKATLKKIITVPGYYKKDGTFVPPAQKAVHYNPDHDLEAIANGGVTHSQKEAHKKLSKEEWFHALDTFEKASHVMAHATDIQDAQSAAAAVSGWKAAAKAGKNPTPSQWAAFIALPKEKQGALYDEVSKVKGALDHLKPPSGAAVREKPAAPPLSIAELEQAKPDPAAAAKKEAEAKAAAEADAKAKDALEALPKTGSHYQKEALKELQKDPAWQAKSDAEKLADVMALYKVKQGAASASAAVSLWKKQMLAGKIPSAAQWSAFQALGKTDPTKQAKVLKEVSDVVGFDKVSNIVYDNGGLVGEGKQPAAPAAAPAPAPGAPYAGFPAGAPKLPLAATGAGPWGNAAIAVHALMLEGKVAEAVKKAQDALTAGGGVAASTHAGVKYLQDVIDFAAGAAKPAPTPAPSAKADKWTGPALPPGWTYTENDGGFSGASSLTTDLPDGSLFYAVPNGEGGFQVGYIDPDGNPIEHVDLVTGNGAASWLANNIPGDSVTPLKGAHLDHLMSASQASVAAPSKSILGVGLPAGWEHWADGKGNKGLKFKTPAGYYIVRVAPNGIHLSVTAYSVGGHVLHADGGLLPSAAIAKLKAYGAPDYVDDALPHLEKLVAKPAATPGPTPRVASVTPIAPPAEPMKSITAPKTILHNTSDGHSKQWAVHVIAHTDGSATMVTEYGKIGGTQQKTSKPFPSLAAAHAAADKLKAEKLKGGYYLHKTDFAHSVKIPDYGAAPATAPAAPAAAKGPGLSPAAVDKLVDHMPLPTSLSHKKAILMAKQAAVDGDLGAVQSLIGQFGATAPKTKAVLQTLADAMQGAAGPKDGDTKKGKSGHTLVFKNGHWHLLMSPTAVKTALGATVGLSVKGQKMVAEAKGAAESGDYAKVLKLANEAKDAGNMGKTAKALTGLLSAVSSLYSVEGLLPTDGSAQTVKPAAAPAAAPAPAPAAAAPAPSVPPMKPAKPGEPVDIASWTKVGQKLGSNEGGTFTDKLGQKWYCKFPGSEEVARNEVLASKFYQMLGFDVPNLKLVKRDGKVGIASKWNDGLKKGGAKELASAAGMQEGFAVDAWLANWDVVGPDFTNTQITKDGKAQRVDVGGSLLYRAQGGKKTDFDGVVKELDSLLDATKNATAKAVFSGAKKDALMHGVQQLNKLKPSQITELVEKIGPGNTKAKAELAQVLIERRAFILKKFGVQDQWGAVAKLDPTKLPVDPATLPPPVQFTASSKPWKNAANNADAAALIAAAASGNLEALKEYKYDAYDEATGQPVGKKSIIDHPSQKLKTQWSELVALLQSIQSPALPTLEMPSMGSADSLEAISDFVGAFNPEERPETVSVEHRAGYFMKLAVIDDIHDMMKEIKPFYLKPASGAQHPWLAATKAKFGSIVSSVKAYINAVQDSGWVNRLWSSGKKIADVSSHGFSYHGGLQKLTKEIYDSAVELPEGTVLTRGMTDGTSGKQTIKALLAAKPGTVFQNTDSMCSSFYEGHGWPGDMVLKITCAKGAKGTPSWASGRFGSEHEITTLPGQRFVLLKAEMKGGKCHVDLLMLPPHDGFVAQVGAMAALGKALLLFFRKALTP